MCNFWPEELYWGTHDENMQDAIAAGAMDHGGRKLDEETVTIVKECLTLGISRMAIAKELGVSRHCIRNIDIGKSWTSVTRASDKLIIVE